MQIANGEMGNTKEIHVERKKENKEHLWLFLHPGAVVHVFKSKYSMHKKF